MKEINGEEIYGIEDVHYSEEAWCEHCMDLEPFDATLDDGGTHWCMDCANYNDDFQLSDNEKKAIEIQELAYKYKYFSDRLSNVAGLLGKAIGDASEEAIRLLHTVGDTEE